MEINIKALIKQLGRINLLSFLRKQYTLENGRMTLDTVKTQKISIKKYKILNQSEAVGSRLLTSRGPQGPQV